MARVFSNTMSCEIDNEALFEVCSFIYRLSFIMAVSLKFGTIERKQLKNVLLCKQQPGKSEYLPK